MNASILSQVSCDYLYLKNTEHVTYKYTVIQFCFPVVNLIKNIAMHHTHGKGIVRILIIIWHKLGWSVELFSDRRKTMLGPLT